MTIRIRSNIPGRAERKSCSPGRWHRKSTPDRPKLYTCSFRRRSCSALYTLMSSLLRWKYQQQVDYLEDPSAGQSRMYARSIQRPTKHRRAFGPNQSCIQEHHTHPSAQQQRSELPETQDGRYPLLSAKQRDLHERVERAYIINNHHGKATVCFQRPLRTRDNRMMNYSHHLSSSNYNPCSLALQQEIQPRLVETQ